MLDLEFWYLYYQMIFKSPSSTCTSMTVYKHSYFPAYILTLDVIFLCNSWLYDMKITPRCFNTHFFFTMDHVHLHMDDREWDGWMASLTQWAWVWAGSGSWWWTGKPGVLQSMGSPRVGHDWATELNWLMCIFSCGKFPCWINRQKQMEHHPGSQ